MFNLFAGKISSVFTAIFQGISQVVGTIVKTVVTVVDTVVDLVTEIASPLTDKLTDLPVLGKPLGAVLDTATDLLDSTSNSLHSVSDQLIAGDLLGGVNTALNNTTDLVGQTLGGVSDILDSVLEAAPPVSHLLIGLPGLGHIVGSVGETLLNVSNLVTETGEYVSNVEPLNLVADLLTNPVGTLGGVVQDVSSGTVENLISDLAPISDAATSIPGLNNVVFTVGSTLGTTLETVNNVLYDIGSSLTKAPSLDLDLPLQFG